MLGPDGVPQPMPDFSAGKEKWMTTEQGAWDAENHDHRPGSIDPDDRRNSVRDSDARRSILDGGGDQEVGRGRELEDGFNHAPPGGCNLDFHRGGSSHWI